MHLKLPAVFVHVACLSQLWAPISHSLISNKEETNEKPCKKKKRQCSDGLMIWVCILIPVGFLALWSELMLGLNCIKTAAGDDRTKSFWVTVFIHGELCFRAEGPETFS